MITNDPFQSWFESKEPNGLMRCDNVYDAVTALRTPEEVYDFVEAMMMASWYANNKENV